MNFEILSSRLDSPIVCHYHFTRSFICYFTDLSGAQCFLNFCCSAHDGITLLSKLSRDNNISFVEF